MVDIEGILQKIEKERRKKHCFELIKAGIYSRENTFIERSGFLLLKYISFFNQDDVKKLMKETKDIKIERKSLIFEQRDNPFYNSWVPVYEHGKYLTYVNKKEEDERHNDEGITDIELFKEARKKIKTLKKPLSPIELVHKIKESAEDLKTNNFDKFTKKMDLVCESVNHHIRFSPIEFMEFYFEALKIIKKEDANYQNNLMQNLEEFITTIEDDELGFVKDQEFNFINKYLTSKYILDSKGKEKSEKKIIQELTWLISQNNINYEKLLINIEKGLNKDFKEMVECLTIDEKNHIILKKLGEGSIKKAYLALNIHSKKEEVLLMIDPNSRGFNLYKKMFPKLSEDMLIQRIQEQEFSTTTLMGLDDRKYIALTYGPLEGRNETGQKVFFLQTQKYERTLEEEISSGKMTQKDAVKYFKQIVYALENCHKEGVVHKDLKPDNIGIDKNGNILLSDFGCVSQFSSSDEKEYQYPSDLKSPEFGNTSKFYNKPKKGEERSSDLFSPATNLWTSGAIFYRMLTGKRLIERPKTRAEPGTKEFDEQNIEMEAQICEIVKNPEKKLSPIKGMDEKFYKVLKVALANNPQERIGAYEMIKKL